MTLLIFMAGCAPTKEAPVDDTAAPIVYGDEPIEEIPGSTSSGGGGGGDEDDDASLFFADEQIHSIDFEIEGSNINALSRAPFEYVEAGVSIDGVEVPSIGVHIKGKYGSYRDIRSKPSLKIDFNRYVAGQRFLGLEKLNLNNSIVDCSYLHDRVAYRMFANAGLPSLRTSYAWVTVNGDDYGLYVVVEAPDDRFLKRSFADDSGNLYDGKYYLADDWSSYVLVDFEPYAQDYFVLDEGTDVGLADIYAVTDAVTDAQRSGDAYARLDPLVNWPEVLRYWAGEQWIGQNDGYVLNQNNYFVYFNPEDGRLQLIPWDLDYSFLEARDWGFSWNSPSGAMAAACRRDDACLDAWKGQVETLLTLVDADGLRTYAEALAALSADLAQEDPKRECSARSVSSSVEDAVTWLGTRSDHLISFWDL